MYTDFFNVRFHNVSELIEINDNNSMFSKGYRMCRVPAKLVDSLNDKAKVSAFFGCGCELRFNMLSDEVKIYLKRDIGKKTLPTGICEIWQGDYQGRYEISPQPVSTDISVVTIKKQESFFLDNINHSNCLFSPTLYRVFLPYDYGNTIYAIEGETSLPYENQTPTKTLLTYGSSITHGSCSLSNSGSYAHLTAKHLHMDLRNLGFAGSCYMDMCMANQIASENWDMALLELGINVVEKELNIQDFRTKCYNFIKCVVTSHTAPVYVISPFYSKKDIYAPEVLISMRNALKNIVDELTDTLNISYLHYIDGLSCLSDPLLLSSDGLHPADSGMHAISDFLCRQIDNIESIM